MLSAPPSSQVTGSVAAGDVPADDVEQATHLLGVEVGIMADAEDALPVQSRLFASSNEWTMTPWNVVRRKSSSTSSVVPTVQGRPNP